MTLDQLKLALVTTAGIPKNIHESINDEEFEKYLEGIINSISSEIELYIGRSLVEREYTEALENAYENRLVLRNSPIKEVISVQSMNGVDLDLEKIMQYTDEFALEAGVIETDPAFPTRMRVVGLGGYPNRPRKSIKVKYVAGYVMPNDETEDNPSDLPLAITNLAITIALRLITRAADATRSDDMIQLTEGNVTRMWGTAVSAELAKVGNFTKAEQKVLNRFRKRVMVVSV